MKKVILVDDKATNLQLMTTLIRQYCPTLIIAATATCVEEASNSISIHRPDIVFLDIEMPDGNGFDLLQRFQPVFFEVIFMTAYSQYAVKAFREQALDYLLKPIDIDALQQAVFKAERQIDMKQAGNRMLDYLKYKEEAIIPAIEKIALPSLDGYVFVKPTQILRCEASGSYTTFHLKDGQKLLVSMRLKACEQLLPGNVFFRVHHSHIVNLDYIQKYVKGRGGHVELEDGTVIDVAATRRDDFLKLIGKHA